MPSRDRRRFIDHESPCDLNSSPGIGDSEDYALRDAHDLDSALDSGAEAASGTANVRASREKAPRIGHLNRYGRSGCWRQVNVNCHLIFLSFSLKNLIGANAASNS